MFENCIFLPKKAFVGGSNPPRCAICFNELARLFPFLPISVFFVLALKSMPLKDTVSRLLYDLGFRRRKSQKNRTMEQHTDRDTQFVNIDRLKQEYLAAGKPVISMDTKKKELLGNFYRDGVTDSIEPIIALLTIMIFQAMGAGS